MKEVWDLLKSDVFCFNGFAEYFHISWLFVEVKYSIKAGAKILLEPHPEL